MLIRDACAVALYSRSFRPIGRRRLFARAAAMKRRGSFAFRTAASRLTFPASSAVRKIVLSMNCGGFPISDLKRFTVPQTASNWAILDAQSASRN